MNQLVTLFAIALIAWLLFKLVAWLSPSGPPQTAGNVIVTIVAIAAVLNTIGWIGSPILIRIR